MPVKQSPPEEITTAQTAEILQVTPRAVLQMIESGKLVPTRKLPGRTGTYLVDRAQVEKLADRRYIDKSIAKER